MDKSLCDNAAKILGYMMCVPPEERRIVLPRIEALTDALQKYLSCEGQFGTDSRLRKAMEACYRV